jgi:phosphoadenosine phosphosulfate reductase
MKSINTFGSLVVKSHWFESFFQNENLEDSGLSASQKQVFTRLLTHMGLIENGKFSDTARLCKALGHQSDSALGIMISNLAYAPEFKWFFSKLYSYNGVSYNELLADLSDRGYKHTEAMQVLNFIKNFLENTRFGEFLCITCGDKKSYFAIRQRSYVSASGILYSLYKYAEALDGYYELRLSTLFQTIEGHDAGISPTQIFGFNYEEMKSVLIGITARNSDFLCASFTHDLKKISLNSTKTPADVLAVIREDLVQEKAEQVAVAGRWACRETGKQSKQSAGGTRQVGRIIPALPGTKKQPAVETPAQRNRYEQFNR